MIRKEERLEGVHEDLAKVVRLAGQTADFMVVQGLRTLEEQKRLFALGKSKTMKSRHLTGHAVDLAPLVDLDGDGDKELSWNPDHFASISLAMKKAAADLKVPLEWGGNWKSFVDMPHFQLPWKEYS